MVPIEWLNLGHVPVDTPTWRTCAEIVRVSADHGRLCFAVHDQVTPGSPGCWYSTSDTGHGYFFSVTPYRDGNWREVEQLPGPVLRLATFRLSAASKWSGDFPLVLQHLNFHEAKLPIDQVLVDEMARWAGPGVRMSPSGNELLVFPRTVAGRFEVATEVESIISKLEIGAT